MGAGPVAGLVAGLGPPTCAALLPSPACSHLLPDLQSPLAQWLGLLVLAPLAVQNRQVVQRRRHLKGGRTEAQ